jgi:DNA-binding protein HU-beta
LTPDAVTARVEPSLLRRLGGLVNKSEFIRQVAAESGLSQKDAAAAVDAVLGTIEDALRSGDEVSFTGFGKFHVAQRGAREGRNPRTGESMRIAASQIPRFTAGSGLKKALGRLPGDGTEDY